MISPDAVRAGRPQLIGFSIVGALGFAVDAGVLTLLVIAVEWHPYAARALSFGGAVTITWYCNRRWVFKPTKRPAGEYGRYLVVQVSGALINLAVYVALIESAPPLLEMPVVPLAAGAIVAWVFNFTATRRLVFSRPLVPGDAATEEHAVGKYSGRENLETMSHARNYNGYLLALIGQHICGDRLLDFGAGTGQFARPLQASGHKLLCVEPDGELRSTLHQHGLVSVAGLDHVSPESVDFIYSLNVLEHIEKDGAALEALTQRLRHGGRLFLYVPAFDCLFSAMDHKVGHFRRYRRSQLAKLVSEAGLVLETCRYVDSIGFVAAWLYKHLGSDSGIIQPASVALYDRFVFPISRIVDRATGRFLGKNLMLVARKA